MAFTLDFADNVRRYLREYEHLSREGRIKLYTTLNRDLRDITDAFRNDPRNRVRPGSACFWYDYLLRDGNRFHRFRFAINDSAAAMGVLQVVFVDAGPTGRVRALPDNDE